MSVTAGSAPLACLHCRRLKMRCIGSDDPPCVRCSKAGRECQVQPSRRGHQRPSVTLQPAAQNHRDPISARFDASNQGILLNTDQISSSVLDLARSGSVSSRSDSPGLCNNWQSTDRSAAVTTSLVDAVTRSQPSHTTNAARKGLPVQAMHPDEISDQTLEDLLSFFCNNLIYFIPIMDDADMKDVKSTVRHKRFLTYAAGLVACEYVPAGALLRRPLMSRVSQCLLHLEGALPSDNDDDVWMQLQAYAVLYAYRPSIDLSDPGRLSAVDRHLNHWKVKSSIEDFAMRLGIHHALSDIRLAIDGGQKDVAHMPAFRKAVYWLWLFTMSHHFSLVTETPPTIRQDRSIQTACALFSRISKPPRVTRMLAEVDLCMLWNLADQALPGLGEWWIRSPPTTIDAGQAARVLNDVDAALDVWSRRWGTRGETDATYPGLDVSMNGAVEFHFRATRFWIRLFATRMITPGSSTVNQIHAELLLKSAEAAEGCCRYLAEVDPATREIARYMADLGFALLAFSGIHVVRVYESLGSSSPILRSRLASVEACGRSLMEMGSESNQIPVQYGALVLEEVARAVSGRSNENAPPDFNGSHC